MQIKEDCGKWSMKNIIPIYNNVHHLRKLIEKPKHWNIRRDVETLNWRAMMAMDEIYTFLFEGGEMPEIKSLHAYDVQFFNKKKLNKQIQYGRQYQLGRITGNFLYFGCCTSLIMADPKSFKPMLW